MTVLRAVTDDAKELTINTIRKSETVPPPAGRVVPVAPLPTVSHR